MTDSTDKKWWFFKIEEKWQGGSTYKDDYEPTILGNIGIGAALVATLGLVFLAVVGLIVGGVWAVKTYGWLACVGGFWGFCVLLAIPTIVEAYKVDKVVDVRNKFREANKPRK